MVRHRSTSHGQAAANQGGYVLVVRGPDGHPRYEVFESASEYRARLSALEQSSPSGVSIEEVVRLLDPRD